VSNSVSLPSRILLVERSKEILDYLKFLKVILDKGAYFQTLNQQTPIPVKKELTHTLKANGYLLLYNVVEATMTQAVADIHGAIDGHLSISGSELVVDDMNPGLYTHILRRFKQGREDVNNTVTPPAGRLIVKYWLRDHEKLVKANKNPLFSGNIDGLKIFEIAQKYGYSDFGTESRLKHKSLFTTKIKRNLLAHGEASFMDCGKDISLPDLTTDAIGVIRCLRHNLSAIEQFIEQAGYTSNAYPVQRQVAVALQPQPA
jgi:hypothetical protein